MFTNLANVVCHTNYFDEISDDLITAFKYTKISKHKAFENVSCQQDAHIHEIENKYDP